MVRIWLLCLCLVCGHGHCNDIARSVSERKGSAACKQYTDKKKKRKKISYVPLKCFSASRREDYNKLTRRERGEYRDSPEREGKTQKEQKEKQQREW